MTKAFGRRRDEDERVALNRFIEERVEDFERADTEDAFARAASGYECTMHPLPS
jgi:hypothetical protein